MGRMPPNARIASAVPGVLRSYDIHFLACKLSAELKTVINVGELYHGYNICISYINSRIISLSI